MARPLPVNMLLAGTGAVLLVSGVGGKSIADILKGSFGKLEVKNPNIGSGQEPGQEQTSLTGGSFGASPVSFSQATIGVPTPVQRNASPPGSALYLARKHEIEAHLGHKLTPKMDAELKDLERRGEL
jgi:hypothetical protein